MAQRDADYGIFVVPSEDKLPARTSELREFNGDKLFVVFDGRRRPRSSSPTSSRGRGC